MVNETITGSSPTAKLVGRDVYVAAGGRIEPDLFAEQGEEIWLDSALVTTLAEARMATVTAAVTGFANVVPVLASRPSFELTNRLRPLRGTVFPPTYAEQERHTAIAAEIDAIMDASDYEEDLSIEESEKIETLHSEADRISSRVAEIDADAKAKAKAYVVIGADASQPCTRHSTSS